MAVSFKYRRKNKTGIGFREQVVTC